MREQERERKIKRSHLWCPGWSFMTIITLYRVRIIIWYGDMSDVDKTGFDLSMTMGSHFISFNYLKINGGGGK